ncbi:helix-turn-helix transcriptional regulator [Bowmanella denitrificans]|uniref:helix-turn-helix transcriptional regulator n=1 Tax=Bowmanella denitrificans TaxID=366582 RepID=UPI000C9AE654|nr:helix-turn-helix domain-containing protein [Bowmanella denitrificans]
MLNQNQILLLALLLLWLLPVILIWVRYQRLPHAQELLLAVLFTPSLLVDQYISAFDSQSRWTFLVGLFNGMPVMIAALLVLAVAKLVLEKGKYRQWPIWSGVALMGILQIPFMLAPLAYKAQLLSQPIVGQLSVYWPLYAYLALCHFLVLFLALNVEQKISDYQSHLSDQVVDTHFYRFSVAVKLFGGLITLAFVSLVVTMLVAFNLLPFDSWRGFVSVGYYLLFLVLTLVLMEQRRYSPSPLDYKALENHRYSDAFLQDVLNRAEKAMIEHKAYKIIGLRLKEFADMAGVNPGALAIASRKLLNRNFRAFVYHYRLEYAKNVLMRSDAKVSAVAKRLGFDSEKFLSGVFVKYIEQMGKDGRG